MSYGKRKLHHIVLRECIHVIVLASAAICLYPIIFMLLTSIRSEDDYNTLAAGWPRSFRLLENYSEAWEVGNLLRLGTNTVIVTLLTIVLCIVFGSMTGFYIAKVLKGRKSKLLFNYFLIGMMVPIQVVMIPLLKLLQNLMLINTMHGILFLYFAFNISFAIFIYTGFFRMVPNELLEAAEIDGCSRLRTFWSIVFPISKTVNATIAILVGLSVWRDLLIPLIYITNPDLKTLPVGLFYFISGYNSRVPLMAAAMALQTLPILILFLSMQKLFIKGLTLGSVKG
ncbi:MAG: carbohydrate ABC transporter permease [Paenibacillaceae bacterium]